MWEWDNGDQLSNRVVRLVARNVHGKPPGLIGEEQRRKLIANKSPALDEYLTWALRRG